MPDLELRLQIHLVIVLRSQTVAHFVDVIPSDIAQTFEADGRFLVQVGHFFFDELEKRRPNQLGDHSVVRRLRLFTNLANDWCDAHWRSCCRFNLFLLRLSIPSSISLNTRLQTHTLSHGRTGSPSRASA